MENSKSHFNFYGWKIACVGFLLMGFSYAPGATLIGLFVRPLMAEFSVSSTEVVLMTSLGIASGVAGSLAAGRLFVCLGIQRLLLPGLLLTALGYAGYGFAGSMGQLYGLALLRGFIAAFLTNVPVNILINGWFGGEYRGRALSIAMIGSGIGAAVLTPVTGWLIESAGWRAGYWFFALLHLALIPPVFLIVRENPEDMGLAPLGKPTGSSGTAVPNTGAAENTSAGLGVLLLAFVLMTGATQSWCANNAAFLKNSGYTVSVASAILTGTSVVMIFGKLSLGTVCDKLGSRQGAVIGMSILTAGFLLLFTGTGAGGFTLCGSLLMGFGLAVVNIAPPLVASDLFGGRGNVGSLMGAVNMAISLGGGTIPVLLSYFYDRTGDYRVMWGSAILLCCASMGILSVMYRRQRQVCPVREKFPAA